jgi:hypothetical protein
MSGVCRFFYSFFWVCGCVCGGGGESFWIYGKKNASFLMPFYSRRGYDILRLKCRGTESAFYG